jgi:alpha-mannosidase
LALKKAEQGSETIVRLVELDGKPQTDVRVSFLSSISAAREVNGQEQPVGPATVTDGTLVTSFSAYQPRTFAIRLGTPPLNLPGVRSVPVALKYDIATASNDGTPAGVGFDGKGNAFPAEMLPPEIRFDDVSFRLAAAKTGVANALVAKGQTIDLPEGPYQRVYVLAAAAGGDQKAAFVAGGKSTELTVEDWSGFIGQWDNRKWVAKDTPVPARAGRPAETNHDDYAEMTGIQPGYIKRADVAWYCSHHHNAAGENVPYGYSYLFAYAIDLPAGAKTITLPNNGRVRIFAISVADESPEVKPAQPLYDTLERSTR